VIGPTGAVRVMVATKPVDFRKGAEGLAMLVREAMLADPFSGTGLRVPVQTRGPDQADLLGWNGSVLVRETAGGRHRPLPKRLTMNRSGDGLKLASHWLPPSKRPALSSSRKMAAEPG
jgi:hypothetical protein